MKHLCCLYCSQPFSITRLTPNLKGRIPLLLSCGHSVCETCLQSILKFAEPIICKDCSRCHTICPTDMKQLVLDEDLLRSVFPINMFLFGVITQQHSLESVNQMPLAPNRIKFTSANKAQVSKNQPCVQNESGLPCAECNLSATCTCNQCNTLLCYICFDRIHSAYNSLKSHVKQPLALAAASKTMTCHTHSGKFLEFFCTNCDKSLCINCMITDKSCGEHEVQPIQEKNADCLDDLKRVRAEANDIYLRLGDTVSALSSLKDEAHGIELCAWNINKHFSTMHALLQLQEIKLMNTLEKIKEEEISAWEAARTDTVKNINMARDCIKAADFAMVESNITKVNIPALIKQLEVVKNMPWYISKEEQMKGPIIHVNEDMCKDIEKYVQVDGAVCTGYNLVATKDIKEGMEIPPQPIKHAFNLSVNELQSGAQQIKVEKIIKPSAPPAVQAVSPTPRPLLEGSHEYMYITHINSPHDFFLQRVIHQTKQMAMMRDFTNVTSMSTPQAAHVIVDKIFLGFNKLEKKWHRCRILSADRRDEAKPVFKVFYIDFGMTDTLTLNKMRVLSAQHQREPALALHARLANCQPVHDVWVPEDIMLMQQITNNKQVVTLMTKLLGASQFGLSLECDVTTADTAVNLVDALVFHERAQYSHPRIQVNYVKRTLLKYFVNRDLKVGDNEDVLVTFVRNPDDFYVRKIRLQEQYSKLTEELNMAYNNNKECVYMPEIGMPVVCNVTNYKQAWEAEGAGGWRRALVLALQVNRRVHVQLVDSGRDLVVHWSVLRRLDERFTHVVMLAIKCHLYGIPPSGKWSNESKLRFSSMCNKILNMEVEETTDKNKKSVAVILRNTEDPDTTVNACFGKHKYANPKNSNNLRHPQATPIPNQSSEKENLTILKKDKNVQERQLLHLEAEDTEKAPSNCPLKIEVKKVICKSPACIYVYLMDQEENFHKLFQEMQQYYSGKELPALGSVEVHDKCAVFSPKFKKWHRAVVEEIDMENFKVKVFLKDMVLSEEVEIGKLKSLTHKFMMVPDSIVKCHLSGVEPAVGNEWPVITKNYLEDQINEHERFYISKHGKISNNSLPIQLWVYCTTAGDALEPNVRQWLNINEKIVQQGLAVPVKADSDERTETEEVPTFPIEEWLDRADADEWGETQPWQPAPDLQDKKFIAIPTELNEEFIIYLHNVCQVQTLVQITAALDEQYQNSVHNSQEKNWSVAQPCIVKFKADNKYHRGTVLAVKENSCTVLFVDYGTVNDCPFENMRKKRQLAEICYAPIQAVQCQITSIKPMEGRWSESLLEYIRMQIISNESLVTVIGDKNNDIYPIEIKVRQVVISDLLVSQQLAYYAKGPSYSSSEDCNDSITNNDSSTDSYTPFDEKDEPDPINEDWSKQVEEEEALEGHYSDLLLYPTPVLPSRTFTCTVTVFLNETDMWLHLISDEAVVSNEFSSITVEMQEEGYQRPPLDGVYEHKACIALFSGDDHWYRAKILQYDEAEGKVKVQYVDYGNKEILSVDKVRESKMSWCNLEVQAVAASLYGVQRGPAAQEDTLLQRYTDFLERPLQAKVVQAQGGRLEVQLYDEGSMRLLYQDLIDDSSLMPLP